MSHQNEQILTLVIAAALIIILAAFVIGYFLGKSQGRLIGKVEGYRQLKDILKNHLGCF